MALTEQQTAAVQRIRDSLAEMREEVLSVVAAAATSADDIGNQLAELTRLKEEFAADEAADEAKVAELTATIQALEASQAEVTQALEDIADEVEAIDTELPGDEEEEPAPGEPEREVTPPFSEVDSVPAGPVEPEA